MAVVALLFSLLLCAQSAMAEDHHYARPSGLDVSGFPPPNAAKFHRSPCPALNSLANRGYIPRDGKNLSPEILQKAVVDVFNLDGKLAQRLTSPLPKEFTLADLSVHNFIEHDASLVHDDSHLGTDPSQVNTTLVDALLNRAQDGKLNKRVMATTRSKREKQCKKENPQYSLSAKAQAVACGESALILLAMGDYKSETINVETARSFLVEEKIPEDFKPSAKKITTATALYLAAQIRLMEALGWGVAETE